MSPIEDPESDEDIDVFGYLEEVEFPADREDLVLAAKDAFAPDELISALENLPDVEFEDAKHVIASLGTRFAAEG